MDTPFMDSMAEGVAEAGYRVVRFEFDYMAERREAGKKRGPDREPKLRAAWHAALETVSSQYIVIGGKSMGGRIASLIADEVQASGLVCLGYPFHPPGRPEKLRTEHLGGLKTPALIVQGERDALGKREEVAGYKLSSAIQVKWLTDGDHSFKPRKSSGTTLEANMNEAIAAVVGFLGELTA